MKKYRKIYEQHYGPIPKDEDGRSYEIHHIDGNHKNDAPENLKAVTIQEHYDIHYSRGDWFACIRMSERMKLSAEEFSDLARKNNRQKVLDGTHHLLGPKNNLNRIKNKTHNFLGDHNPSKNLHPVTCPYCFRVGKGSNMLRWHFDNCKFKPK